MHDPMARMKQDFIADASETIEEMSRSLTGREPDESIGRSQVDLLFRTAHSLKGTAGMFDLHGVSKVAEAVENLLELVRSGDLAVDSAVADLLLEALDEMGILLKRATGYDAEDDSAAVVRKIEAFLASLSTQSKDTDTGGSPELDTILDDEILRDLQPLEQRSVVKSLRRGNRVYDIEIGAGDTGFGTNGEKLRSLAGLGEIIWVFPTTAGARSSIRLVYVLSGSHDEFENMVAVVGARVREITPRKRTSGQPVSQGTEKADTGGKGPGESKADDSVPVKSQLAVKVDIAILDSMMNTVSEIYTVRAGLMGVANRLPRSDRTRRLRDDLLKLGILLDKRIADLEGSITSVRLTPISMLFERYRGEVRRLARHRGKTLKLAFEGESTQVDRALLQRLHDPVLHIIRNAVDHGIESSDERTQSGKPAEGTILVKARQDGSHIRIDIEDDGRGIDEEKVRASAKARGIRLEDGESPLVLLFKAGLSTKEEADEISGRGVGLDAAKTQIEAMRGMITVDTHPGEGSKFSIWVPLALAVSRGILVEEGDVPAVVPLGSVVEVLRLTRARREEVEEKGTITYKGVDIRVAVLSEMFGIDEPRDAGFIVIVGVGESRRAVAVERVRGETDIVTRPLPAAMIAPRFITGAAELDDGRAAVIIQPEEILRESAGECEVRVDTAEELLSGTSAPAEEWTRERMLRILVFSRGGDLYGVPLGLLSEVIPTRRITAMPVLGKEWQGLFFARGMCHGLIGMPGPGAAGQENIRRMILLKFPERCGFGATEVLGHFVLPHQRLKPDPLQDGSSGLATFGVFEWKGSGVRVLDIRGTLSRALLGRDGSGDVSRPDLARNL
ncbi:MAG: chemotaxis protein CheW [Candidatus Eisenbacteria bacterium]